jgi:demethylmenaquinone methyltransferase/2-methoxy-6-polyprenyl-1,4-benzoquinol methylase
VKDVDAHGTAPPGTADEQEAAGWVRQMFARVAPRYDLLNHLLSFNIDKGWRKRLIAAAMPLLGRPGAWVLDLCCGTGDVLMELERHSTGAMVLGGDFCHPMLVAADRKIRERRYRPQLFEGDALQLPLSANSLDVITIAFGFRNFANYDKGLRELARVLKPGGILAILEFSHPRSKFVAAGYGIYSRAILPWIGGMISGSRDAYTYLPQSIKKFPSVERLREMMTQAGFAEVRYELLTGGIAALHVGVREGKSQPLDGGRGEHGAKNVG